MSTMTSRTHHGTPAQVRVRTHALPQVIIKERWLDMYVGSVARECTERLYMYVCAYHCIGTKALHVHSFHE